MTKHDLKELAAMGAELGAAKAENERLRGLLRTAWRLRPDHDYHDEHMQAEQKAWEVETAEVLNAADAPSQQAEPCGGCGNSDESKRCIGCAHPFTPVPTDTFTAVDMATAAAQGFRDGQAAMEPAPAKAWPALAGIGRDSGHPRAVVLYLRHEPSDEHLRMIQEALRTRPAQTEQQPVEVMPFQFKHPDTGDAHAVALTRQEVADGMEDTLYEKLADLICHCEPVGETNVVDCNCDEYIYEFELVNAAPIAQTAQRGEA